MSKPRSELDRAMEDVLRSSRPGRPSSPTSSNVPALPATSRRDQAKDAVERVRIFTKMFVLYPPGQNRDLRQLIEALCSETRDIPAWWLSVGLSVLVKQPGRVFAPTLGEIREGALTAIRSDRRQRAFEAKGGTGPAPNPGQAIGRPDPPLNEARELAFAWAHEVERRAAASGLEVRLLKVQDPAPAGATAATFHGERSASVETAGAPGIVAPGASYDVSDVEDMP